MWEEKSHEKWIVKGGINLSKTFHVENLHFDFR